MQDVGYLVAPRAWKKQVDLLEKSTQKTNRMNEEAVAMDTDRTAVSSDLEEKTDERGSVLDESNSHIPRVNDSTGDHYPPKKVKLEYDLPTVPCSVITSHGDPGLNPCNTSATIVLDQTSYNIPILSLPNEEDSSIQQPISVSETAVLEFVSNANWTPVGPPNTLQDVDQQTGVVQQNNEYSCRERKRRRPYSPVMVTNKKLIEKKKNFKKRKKTQSDEGSQPKPFSCDKCKSPYVVNPSRSHLSDSGKKRHRPRKAVDPVTKKLLLLCNACGLSMVRPKKEKQRKDLPVEDAKHEYMTEALNFSTALAKSLEEPDAARLYCPSFKFKACRCVQNYITDKGVAESQKRALYLLCLLKDAKRLSKLKNVKSTKELKLIEDSSCRSEKKMKQTVLVQRGFSKRRSQVFEDFVLSNRRYLRNEIGLCERACQRVLMYSNNFLHKHLKSSPDKGPRIPRVSGRNARGLLKPISQLPNESCCHDKCVMLAVTHSKLLESWRASANAGQREARRVLAEMLTPSGGTKANCHRFISMVTGCSHTTICLVNKQMRRTKGDREPPEHGLKRWWRDHPKGKDKRKKSGGGRRNKSDSNTGSTDEDDPAACLDVADISIPTEEELQRLDPLKAAKQLQKQRQKLLQLKRHLARQQQLIDEQQQQLMPSQQLKRGSLQQLKVNTTQDKSSAVTTILEPQVNCMSSSSAGPKMSQQLLRILEIPSSSSSVIASMPDTNHPQPSISVMTTSGEFEPIGNISVSLSGNQTTFSNVVFLPETTLETSVIGQESGSAGVDGLGYAQGVVDPEGIHMTAVPTSQSQPHIEYSLVPAVFPASGCDLPRLYYLDS